MKNLFFSLGLSFLSTSLAFAHNYDVLVFTKTQSGVPNSETAGSVTALQALGTAQGFNVTESTNSADFNATTLASYEVVVFLNTEGNILNSTEESAFQTWFEAGGSFVGLHGSADTEPTWTWYHNMLGATQSSESASTTAKIEVLDSHHPISLNSAEVWNREDVWPNFSANPRGDVHVIAVLEEDSYVGGTMGDDHPIIWCQEFNGGLSAYVGMGSTALGFSDSIFETIIHNAFDWAARETAGDNFATLPANYSKQLLIGNLAQPLAIDFDSAGNVYVIERSSGRVKRWNANNSTVTTIADLNVYSAGEFGLLGLALSPDFDTTGHLYLCYSPPASVTRNQRISRFTLSGNTLGSEVVIIDYPVIRNDSPGVGSNPQGHHQGGCLRFDNDGNLLLSIGDNTDASQYAPVTSSLEIKNALKAANTSDLRGKIIRITPNVGGGPAAHPNYTIPTGNLFENPTSTQRGEIYVMGCRNPFRFCIDPHTNWLYFGDVGPDAQFSGTGNFQGAVGHDEFNQVRTPSNRGWPFSIGFDTSYLDGSGQAWTPSTIASFLQSHFNNAPYATTGDTSLPPVDPAWIAYTYNNHLGFTEFRTIAEGTRQNRAVMAGDVFKWQPGSRFPRYHDKTVFLMDYSRNIFVEVKTDAAGDYLEATRFLPSLNLQQPIEMKFGPDGRMYYLEYGRGDLSRIDYSTNDLLPSAIASSDITSGSIPLTVQFTGDNSFDTEDGQNITYSWNFGDGSPVVTTANPQHTFVTAGTYNVQLTVSDTSNNSATANITISAGNNAPIVDFAFPPNRGFFDWGDNVSFQISVNDVEDGTSSGGQITSSDVLFEGSLGHAEHQHNELQFNSLGTTVNIPRDAGHGFDDNLYYVFDAFYTDQGATNVDPVNSSSTVEVLPKVFMAQFYDNQSGVSVAGSIDPIGGSSDVVSIDNEDWVVYENINLLGISELRVRASSENGGTIEFRSGSPTGTLLGSVSVTPTGSASSFADFTAPISNPGGQIDLYLVFKNAVNPTNIIRLNYLVFRGTGLTTDPERPKVVSVSTSGSDKIKITFDQPVDFATCSNIANYVVSDSVTISSVDVASDQFSVELTTSTLTPGQYYSITLANIEDLAGDSVASGTKVVSLYNSAGFVFGLNAGGPNYTDSNGNTFVADSGNYTLPGNNAVPATVLIDFAATAGAVASSPSDFAAADSAVAPSASINVITTTNPTNEALTGFNISGVTWTHTGANGVFNTNKGKYDGTPLLDGYLFEPNVEGASASNGIISGIGNIVTGEPITLTVWGVGDTANSDNRVVVSYNGADITPIQTTDYDGTINDAYVQYTFNKVAGVNDIGISWGKATSGGSTTGLNAISLTTAMSQTNSASAPYVNTGAATSTFNTADNITNTSDPQLYQTERFAAANFGYTIPLDNGIYEVTLKFADIFFTANNSRVFNAQLEGQANLFSPALDIHAVAPGHDVAYDSTHPITITDGFLNVDFIQGAADNPKISAIEISQAGISVPATSFANFLTTNSNSNFNPDSDIDDDGKSLLLEYALGTNPEVSTAGDVLVMPTPATSPINSLSFVRPTGLPDITYTLEASEDMIVWETLGTVQTSSSPAGSGFEQIDYSDIANAAIAAGLIDGTKCFYRLKVTLTNLP